MTYVRYNLGWAPHCHAHHRDMETSATKNVQNSGDAKLHWRTSSPDISHTARKMKSRKQIFTNVTDNDNHPRMSYICGITEPCQQQRVREGEHH
jgi:hypothetical protein